GEHVLAIALEFGRADAADGGERRQVRRVAAGDLLQRGIVEDDVGGQVLLARTLAAPGAQALEARQGLAIERRAYRLPVGGGIAATVAPGSPRTRRREVAAQRHARLALLYRPRRRRQPQAAEAVAVHVQVSARHQLAEHAAPGGGVEVGADAVGRQAIVPEFR